MYVVVVSDWRFPKLYGCAVSDDGLYCSNPSALVDPIRFKTADAARQDARFRLAATRVNGEGRGHGIMHTVMTEAAWLRHADKRIRKSA